MYQYRNIDQKIVDERVEQFRDQVRRRLNGELSEDEFRPLRLMNGLYLQRHAYMLRVAIPYGLLSSEQVRKLAYIAREYDRGYGHITTRQNIQYNWPRLEEVPDLLADLAEVQMHAIQTSGNCVRNVTADQFSGIANDEVADPRPWCELMRQYSTFHPEFSYLPRKFKIAFSGCEHDSAATVAHDIGFRMVRNDAGEVGIKVIVGGGLGRTPILGPVVREFLKPEHMLSYTEAILRVYNLQGNRKNKYKARIKILVRKLGVEEFRRRVEEEWEKIRSRGANELSQEEIERVKAHFVDPEFDRDAADDESHLRAAGFNPAFKRWLDRNVKPHKVDGYNIVHITLKAADRAPGDITADEMDLVADLADAHSLSEVRTTHEQNLILPHVKNADLLSVWEGLQTVGLGEANLGTINDMICCPGLDFCALANAGSIGVAKKVYDRFDDIDYLYDLGDLQLKMSGCINACGHHHVGHIGILGIDKRGEEFYQVMLGGSATDDASLGKWIGPAIAKDDIVDAIETILEVYLEERQDDERFLDTYRRVGVKPFSARVYADAKVKPLRATA